MPPHPALANPMWTALSTVHAAFAQTVGPVKRFAPDVAPFCAVEGAGAAIGGSEGFTPGETVYFLGPHPLLPPGWTVVGESSVLQMVFAGPAPPLSLEDAPARNLGPEDLPAMQDLTALVYPEFFRARTTQLGGYIGLDGDACIRAMAGRRLACPGYREISAVCTHPHHRGQGLASQLLRQLSRLIIDAGETPFLHVSASNSKAWGLYQGLGFVASRELPFAKVRVGPA